MTRLFFLLSGEHDTLPRSELYAALEAERLTCRSLARFPQVEVAEGDLACVEAAARRCGMLKIAGLALLECEADAILDYAKGLDLTDIMRSGESFAVRIKRIQGSSRDLKRDALERDLGAAVLDAFPKAKVDLENPDKIFVGFLTGGRFVFGLRLAEIRPKPFLDRSPLRRPFFHPSTMPPKLARCMVNLARARRGETILDPFCGVGGILIEAGLIDCRVLGSDLDREMVERARQNLLYYGIDPIGVAVCDARHLCFSEASSIATDPPYGRASSTMGVKLAELASDFLNSARDILAKDGFLCTAIPQDIDVEGLARETGFRVVEKHALYVHAGLTRLIVSLKA